MNGHFEIGEVARHRAAKQDADIRLAYSRFAEYRKHGEPIGKGAFIEMSEQDAFIRAVQELLR